MSSGRMRRVDEAVWEVVSEAITSGLKDPRIGFVTVTAVQTSSDLRHARVLVSVLGDAKTRKLTLDGLQSARGHLQQQVAARLRIKHTPALTFVHDETTEQAQRLTELIDRVAPPAADGQDAAA